LAPGPPELIETGPRVTFALVVDQPGLLLGQVHTHAPGGVGARGGLVAGGFPERRTRSSSDGLSDEPESESDELLSEPLSELSSAMAGTATASAVMHTIPIITAIPRRYRRPPAPALRGGLPISHPSRRIQRGSTRGAGQKGDGREPPDAGRSQVLLPMGGRIPNSSTLGDGFVRSNPSGHKLRGDDPNCRNEHWATPRWGFSSVC